MAHGYSSWTKRKSAPGAAPDPALSSLALVRVAGLDRVLRRLERHRRVLELAQTRDQLVPLARLEDGVELLRSLAAQRVEAHVDVIVVVGQRERVVRVRIGHQGDDLVR